MRCLGRCRELQQLAQGGGTRPVQGRAHRHLRGFQIQSPRLAPILKNHPQELIYFAAGPPARSLPPFFFRFTPLRRLPLHRTQLANLLVNLHEVLTQGLKTVELGDLPFGLAQGGRVGEGLCHRLALDLPGETKIRSMARMPRTMASTVGLATASGNAGDRAPAKVSQPGHLLNHLHSLSFQLGKSCGHKPPYPSVYIR